MKTVAITPTWCRVVRSEPLERSSVTGRWARRPEGREGTVMAKKVGIGAIAAALLLSGGLVGVSYGGTGGIPEPQTIELQIDVCRNPHFFFFGDPEGPKSADVGQVTLCRSPIFDANGDRVGTHNTSCTVSDRTDWICTHTYVLRAGPFTEDGTIIGTGNYTGGDGDEIAITGGTGAYQDVGGYAVQGDGDHTLNLIP
jgi:hypothetical protein